MTTHQTHHKTDREDSVLWATLAYVLSIVGFLLVVGMRKHDRYAMFHAKQSLILFFGFVIAWLVEAVVPFVGWFVGAVLTVLLVILWVIGIVNALRGKETPLPVVGVFAEKITI